MTIFFITSVCTKKRKYHTCVQFNRTKKKSGFQIFHLLLIHSIMKYFFSNFSQRWTTSQKLLCEGKKKKKKVSLIQELLKIYINTTLILHLNLAFHSLTKLLICTGLCMKIYSIICQ